MATAPEYSKEQLNYFRICFVTTDVITEGLRTVFKQEWDNNYKATLREWKDEPRNGLDFKNGETLSNQERNQRLLTTMVKGNRAEWDCTMLFYAILYSDCIGPLLTAAVRSKVDDLRKFRNEEFAHLPEGSLSDPEFQTAIAKVDLAFQALGLSTQKIQEITNQTSFPTEELSKVLKEVDDLKKELKEKEEKLKETEKQRQVLEDQLQTEVLPFCVLPPKPSHDVAGRDHEVAKMTEQLKELKEANGSRLSYLYISGNPGSGKSQLAGLVAKRLFEENKRMHGIKSFVMTLNAENLDSLLESYATFARRLKCPEYAVTNTLNCKDLKTEEKIASLKSLVDVNVKLYPSCLLLVDNVTDLSSMNIYLPDPGDEQWCRGQMLITTQDTASIPSENSFTQHVSVSRGMEVSDATSLLATISGITDSEMEKEVARALDYQPLALAIAATYVKQMRGSRVFSSFGWKDYLEKLDKGQRANTATIFTKTNPSYPKSMTAAITLAVENAMSSDEPLRHTFSLISLCAHQPLNLEIVINYILNLQEQNILNEDKDLICWRIRKCSLLLLEEDDNDVYIHVHQVVRDVIKMETEKLSESQQREAMHGAIISFQRFVDDNQLEDLNSMVQSFQVVAHFTCLIVGIENTYSKDDISEVIENTNLDIRRYPDYFTSFGRICKSHCNFKTAKRFCNVALQLIQRDGIFSEADAAGANTAMGNIFLDLGEFHKAKHYLNEALTFQLQTLGPHDVDVATSYNNLACVLHAQGDLQQAKEYYDHALAIKVQKLGPQHVDVATSYNNLGSVLGALDDLQQAKEYFDRALAIRLQKLGPQDVHVATSYNNLGCVLRDQGDLQQAKECYDRALAIQVQKLGPEHVDVATSYNDLGFVLFAQCDMKQAKEYYDRALAIRLQKLGPQHVDVATSYNSLGSVFRAQGDLQQAKECYDRALAIRLQKLGPQHVDVATSYNSLGSVLRAQGDLQQAKEYYDRALAIRLQELGPKHVNVATSYNSLGSVLRAQGDLQQAKEYCDRALAIRLQKLGPQHVNVATSYNNLGFICHEQGDLQQAKDYYDRALAIRLQKLAPQHVHVATSYNNLGSVLRAQGDLQKAKEYYDRALAIRLQTLGPQHVDVATSYNDLGSVLRDQGDLQQAKECYDRALAIRLQKLGPQHVHVATSYNNLGSVLRDQGDLQQAKEYYDRALAIRLQKLGPQHVDVATSYNNLGSIFRDQGDLQQAKEYYDRSLTILLHQLGPDHIYVANVQCNLAELLQQMKVNEDVEVRGTESGGP